MSVLSIQSGVVAGFAGNSAASFCLQRSGVDCWRLDTVQYSNHTGYEGVRGRVFSAQELQDVFEGIREYIGLQHCSAVLSGYLGTLEIADFVLHALKDIRNIEDRTVYLCDPVLGDDDGFYVNADLADFIGDKLLPEADIVMPNRFELGVLSGLAVDGRKQVVSAARSLLNRGRTQVCVATGIPVDQGMSSFAVLKDSAYQVTTPFIKDVDSLGGTGDMTAALFLAQWLKTQDVADSLSKAVSSAYGIIQRTSENKAKELCLIEAQQELQTPSQYFFAQTVD